MARRDSEAWNLEQFLDSLILELDKAQDTLALKGVTRKLTYTVKDVALDLNVFPVFENGKVKLQMAKPGDAGGSRISFQLGSITDRQIREHSNDPVATDDLSIDSIEEIDDDVKESLRKVGVKSTRDLEKLEKRDVDIGKVVKDKAGSDKDTDYSQLANIINKARRKKLSPQLSAVTVKQMGDNVELTLKGKNFVLQKELSYPAAFVNDQPAQVIHAESGELRLAVPRSCLRKGDNAMKIALDPYAVVQMSIES